jgi:hypothetical protein
MKSVKSKVWLGLSLFLNAALLIAIVVAVGRARHPAPGEVGGVAPPEVAGARTTIEFSRTAAPGWVQPLRNAGVRNPVLARIVMADFEERWELRRRELQRQLAAGDVDGDALARFEQQHDAEEESELRAVLGDDGFRQWDKTRLLRDFDVSGILLSAQESDSVYDLKRDFARRQHELIESRGNGELDEDDFNDRRAELQGLYDQQLKSALGEDRYAMLHDSVGDAQAVLRRSLKGINANDTQVAAILDAEHQWTDRRAEFERSLKDHPLTPEEYDVQSRTLDAARDEQYQRLLGADGFHQFQKNQDSRYQLMRRYASAWNLTDGDIDHVYSMLREFEKNSGVYKSTAQQVQQGGQSVDWPGVTQNLQQFTQQTEQAFRAYLGDDRFTKLSENNVLELGR